jgi:hypothetical protein
VNKNRIAAFDIALKELDKIKQEKKMSSCFRYSFAIKEGKSFYIYSVRGRIMGDLYGDYFT